MSVNQYQLITSYKKSKNFHPSKVKLRTTHYKTLLVPSDLTDPADPVKIDQFEIREHHQVKTRQGTHVLDYEVQEVSKTHRNYQEAVYSDVRWRVTLQMNSESDKHLNPQNIEATVVFTDYFGHKGLTPELKLDERQVSEMFMASQIQISELFSKGVKRLEITNTAVGVTITIDGKEPFYLCLGPGRNEQTVPVDLLVNPNIGSPLLPFPEERFSDYFSLAKNGRIDQLLTADALWLGRRLKERHLGDEIRIQITHDMNMVHSRLVEYLKPFMYFVVEPMAERADQTTHHEVAAELLSRFDCLEKCDLASCEADPAVLAALRTDWMAMIAKVQGTDEALVGDLMRTKRVQDPHRSGLLLKTNYPVGLTKLVPLSIGGDVVNAVLDTSSGKTPQIHRQGQYSAWIVDHKLHFTVFPETKVYILDRRNESPEIGGWFGYPPEYLQIQLCGGILYFCDKAIYAVDLQKAKSEIDKAGGSGSQPKMSDNWMRHPQVLVPSFEICDTSYFAGRQAVATLLSNGHFESDEVLRFCPVKQTTEEDFGEVRLPQEKGKVAGSPDFIRGKWVSSVLHLNMAYHSFDGGQATSVSILLVAYRYDPTANSMSLLTSEILPVSQFRLYSLPVSSAENYSHWVPHNTFLTVRGRVFSVSVLDRWRLCLFVHCFHRNRYEPIGGSDCGTPGLYCLSTERRYVLDTQSRRQVGVYGVEQTGEDEKGGHMYRMFRYYLRF